jgi:hypothetical protein
MLTISQNISSQLWYSWSVTYLHSTNEEAVVERFLTDLISATAQ